MNFYAIVAISYCALCSAAINAKTLLLTVDLASETNNKLVDSLIYKLNKEKNDTSKVNLLNKISWNLAPIDIEKSIIFADSSIKLSEKIDWKIGKAKALNNKGEALRNKGSFEEALKQHKSSLQLFIELNDLDGQAKTESNLGITYFSLSDFSKSFSHFDNALELFKKLNKPDGILNSYGYMGVLFSNFNQHDKAIDYYKKALEIAVKLNNKSKMATQYNNLGIEYNELRKYSESIFYYNKAIDFFNQENDEFNYSIALGNIGIPYTKLKRYSEAKSAFYESLKFAKKLDDEYGVAHQYGNIGELYLAMNEDKNIRDTVNYLHKAIDYLKRSVKEFELVGAIEDQKDYLEILAKANNKFRNYQEAYNELNNVIKLKDLIQSKENLKVTAGLEIKQELENKENEIVILNKEKEFEIMMKTAISIFSFLVVIIAFLILYFYRKKRKDNFILKDTILQKEEIEKILRSNEIELTNHKVNLEKLVSDRTIKLEKEITEHKKTEEALSVALDNAEIANKAKSVFLANMSHELRTPLVGILGYSDLLQSILEDEEAQEMAEGINRTGKRLLNTLSLVLDLARVESDMVEVNIKEIDLIERITDTYKNFKGLAERKKLRLNLNLHADKYIYSIDEGMFNVIIENLINNAIKFTKEGEIIVTSNVEYMEDKPKLIIKVIDSGIGIKQNDIPLIFKEFKQLSEGFTKDFQGSGLGLAITKKYIDLLGGEIKVESEFGKGTTFKLIFPVKIQKAA